MDWMTVLLTQLMCYFCYELWVKMKDERMKICRKYGVTLSVPLGGAGVEGGA